MATDRSDKLHADWRASTEKFDYFILGVICALCAFIAQGYRPERLGVNPAALELFALLVFVFAVVSGFKRIEQTLLVAVLNHRELHAFEARGGMVTKMQTGQTVMNEATGQIFTQQQAMLRVEELTKTILATKSPLSAAKSAAHQHYKIRNFLALAGFLLLLAARVWSACA